MLCPVRSLGPGNRVCLWTQGCSKGCPGCISPEMRPHTGADVPEETLAGALISAAVRAGCGSLTVSGGDPFEQSGALFRLLSLVRGRFRDILVYTGFTVGEIRAGAAGADGVRCLGLIDVLIDGRYVEELNTPGCALRGSENQNIIFLAPALEPVYREYMKGGRTLETFVHGGEAVITGIPDRKEDT